MNFFAIVGAAVISAVLCILIRQYQPESALGVSIACGVVLTLAALSMLSPAVDAFSQLSERAGMDSEFSRVLLKALAVCWITRIGADGCRDAGESAIAARLELAGKAAVLVISLPVFLNLAELVTSLLGGM